MCLSENNTQTFGYIKHLPPFLQVGHALNKWKLDVSQESSVFLIFLHLASASTPASHNKAVLTLLQIPVQPSREPPIRYPLRPLMLSAVLSDKSMINDGA